MKKIFIFVMLVLETSITLSQESDSIINLGYGPALASGNDTLPFRKQTLYIILHTMEGNLPGGLKRLCDNALCNFAVDDHGIPKPIVDIDRVANHAGHSTWNGMDSISLVSVGIEFEGFYNEEPTKKQYRAEIDSLIARIQRRYGIPDSCVLTHPMVACYYPWDPGNPHPGYYTRGRKHDAYYFAKKWVRDSLGLSEMATVDLDVYSGRVIQNIAQAKRFYHHVVTSEEIQEYQIAMMRKRMSDTILVAIVPIRSYSLAVSSSNVELAPSYFVQNEENFISPIDKRRKKNKSSR